MDFEEAIAYKNGDITIEEALMRIMDHQIPFLMSISTRYRKKFGSSQQEALSDAIWVLWKLLETWKPEKGMFKKRMSVLWSRMLDHGHAFNFWRRPTHKYKKTRFWVDPRQHDLYMDSENEAMMTAYGLYLNGLENPLGFEIIDEKDLYDCIPGQDDIKRDLLECLKKEGSIKRAIATTSGWNPEIPCNLITHSAKELVRDLRAFRPHGRCPGG